MRFKKSVAAALAAVIMAGGMYVPGSFSLTTEVQAADTDVVVNFKDSADPLVNSIVTGGTVKMDVKKPSGYQESADSANGLKITYGTDYTILNENGLNVTGDADKELNIYADPKTTTGKDGFFTVLKTRVPNAFTEDKTTWVANINIEGSYDALLEKGHAIEVGMNHYLDNGTPKEEPMGSLQYDFSISPSITSFAKSELVLVCETSETANQAPTFKITKKTYAFEKFVYDGITRRNNDTENLVIRFTVPGSNPRTITIKPDSFYANDDKGTPFKDYPVAEGETAPEGNFYVQKGTTFTFTIDRPASNSVLLTVYSPEAASEQIRQNIESTSGSTTDPYVRLADGDKLNFIRKNFQVAYNTSRFNTDFYLKWEWVPDNTTENNKYTEKQLKEAVLFADQPSGFQTVTVNPLYGDVTGKLVATIHCRRSDAVAYEKAAEVKITIKGTGQPASLQRISRWEIIDPNAEIRKVDEIFFDDDPDKPSIMPNEIFLNAYDGTVPDTEIPEYPSRYKIRLNMGRDNASSQYAVVECVEGNPELVTMQTQASTTDAGNVNDYQFGGQITNPLAATPATEGNMNLIFTPVKTGNRTPQRLKIKVTFFVLDADGKPVEAITQPSEFWITVKDDSPSSDATLRTLVVRGKTENSSSMLRAFWPEINIGFDPATTEYNLELPYEYEAFDFTPTRNEPHAKDRIQINVIGVDDDDNKKVLEENWKDNKDEGGYFLINGRRSPEVPLIENKLVQVEIIVTAEDTSTQMYKLNILRKPMGVDATLKSLTMTDTEGNVLFDGIQQNVFEYTVEIPFKVQRAEIAYELNDPNAPRKTKFVPALEKNGIFTEAVWLNIINGCKEYDAAHPDEPATTRRMDLQITTYAEDCKFDLKGEYLSGSTTQYTIHIRRADPSEVNTLQTLEVLDDKNDDAVIEYTPTFHKDMDRGDYYDVEIPYSSSRIKIRAQADDSGSTVILRDIPRTDEERDFVIDGTPPVFGDPDNGGKGWERIPANSPSSTFTPIFFDEENQEGTYHTVELEVWPESTFPPSVWERPQGPSDPILEGATYTYQEYMQKVVKYPIHIYRAPPSTIDTLASVKMVDQDGNVIDSEDFDEEGNIIPGAVLNALPQNEYTINVPYEIVAVQITPTATDPLVHRITVNNRAIDNGTTSSPIKLNDYKESPRTEIKIEVYPESYLEPEKFPENQEPNVYTITVVRGEPRHDCNLIKLETQNTSEFKPVFAPMRTEYAATVAEGAEGVIVIPTAYDEKGATITVDGKRVESGQPSELIHIITVHQTIKVVVTAQDGETTKTYNIRVTNPNLINKTSNADLSNLDIEPGVRRPIEFDPSVTEYDISVDEETYAVKLFPTPADSMAEMKVFRGSQEIGDEDGNYASSIQDGANTFTIEVTAPDESKKKTYTVTIYRNDEENMGRLTPLHAEDIDYENAPDVIIVDVTKYPRIHRDVFEELKNYPDKKIIFQGNDYSLQFDASDIDKVIPSTEIYTFGMSFRSPLEIEISDEIYSHAGNSDANLVFVYFDHHGQLPGPAVLTLSLGSKYRNSTFYWNYYNEERQRVDYYGLINTNSKGTFSLIIDHLSTYIISDQKLIGANDVSTDTVIETLSPYNDKDLGAEAVDKKLIPNTGASAD